MALSKIDQLSSKIDQLRNKIKENVAATSTLQLKKLTDLASEKSKLQDAIEQNNKIIEGILKLVNEVAKRYSILPTEITLDPKNQEGVRSIIEAADQRMQQLKESAEQRQKNLALLERIPDVIKQAKNTENGFPRKAIGKLAIEAGWVTENDPIIAFNAIAKFLRIDPETYNKVNVLVKGEDFAKQFNNQLTIIIAALKTENEELIQLQTDSVTLKEQQDKLTKEYVDRKEIEQKQKDNKQADKDIDTQVELLNKERKPLEEELPQLEEKLQQVTANTAVANEVKKLLKEYQDGRSERFNIKDKLNAKDKKIRDKHINETIKNALDVYADADDKISTETSRKDLIDKLQAGLDSFKGIHIKTFFSRAILQLMEKPELQTAISVEDLLSSQKIAAPQNANDETKNQYIENILKLCRDIDMMPNAFANIDEADKAVLQKLVTDLKKDVTNFVVENKDQMPTQESFDEFKTIFKARLHSQDVIMSKHDKWGSFALNLFLGVITAGIALGIKALHSKRTTGTVTFFARETEKQAKVNEVDASLDNIQRPT